jgi:DNA/RNA endonuclease YhcR with UshA esterase domain
MKRKITALLGLVLVLALLTHPTVITAQETITAADANKYVGQKATVCGIVASATFSSRSKGQPTFLNLDQPYPRQIFTVVIWGKDRRYFSSPPEIAYRGKRICVTGLVELYKGKPEIIVILPTQIAVKSQ